MNPDDIGFLGVRDLMGLYRARKLSPVEVVQATLARIERIEPRVNAMMRLTPEIALTAAKRSETVFSVRRHACWKAFPSPSRICSTPRACRRILLAQSRRAPSRMWMRLA